MDYWKITTACAVFAAYLIASSMAYSHNGYVSILKFPFLILILFDHSFLCSRIGETISLQVSRSKSLVLSELQYLYHFNIKWLNGIINIELKH